MVGQGVLRECVQDAEVTQVLSVVRRASPSVPDKVHELVHADFTNYAGVERELTGYDACFFCLGISSAGMSEADYSRITYDFTVRAAETLARTSPALTFIYVSGAGTDSTEKGGTMWARVKGKAENALLSLPFKAAYMFRPGLIQPLHGIKSRTAAYRLAYIVLAPFIGFLRSLFPNKISTTETIGRAMLVAAKRGAPKRFLENADINALAATAAA
jgi:uncharacterized protein YbjT (DUF2867 family)